MLLLLFGKCRRQPLHQTSLLGLFSSFLLGLSTHMALDKIMFLLVLTCREIHILVPEIPEQCGDPVVIPFHIT